MIGEMIQHILDKKFLLSFTYDGRLYHFRAWKFYENDMCHCSWMIDDTMVSEVATKEILIMEADRHLKQVDDAILRRRLTEEAGGIAAMSEEITKTKVLINGKTEITVAHPKCDDACLIERLKETIKDATDVLILRSESDEFPDLEFNQKWERLLSLADL